MADAPGEFQKALYAALAANSTLTGIASIHDGAPLNSTMPYVDLGEVQDVDWGSKSFVGDELYLTMHTWSDTQSKGQTWSMMNQIKTTLHQQTLSVTGQNFVLMRHEDTQVFRDGDGVTWHGVTRYRAITHE